MRRILAVFCSVLVLAPLGAPAVAAGPAGDALSGNAPACFSDVCSTLKPGTPLTTHLAGGQQLSGSFLRFSPDSASLAIHPLDGPRGASLAIDLRDVTRLDYRARGHFQGGYMLLGMFGGLLIGSAVGGIAASTHHDDGFMDFTRFFIFAGCAGGGLVLGGIVGALLPLTPHTQTVECAGDASATAAER